MTAAYLCGATGIENRTIDNSAAYIAGGSNSYAITPSSSSTRCSAQRACDYILNVKN